jgi:hypothetical protein
MDEYVWGRKTLEIIADQEAQFFQDPRVLRLYRALCRHKGWSYEPIPPEVDTQTELNAALADIGPKDIVALPLSMEHMVSISAMHQLVQSYDRKQVLAKSFHPQSPSDDQDSDPEPDM